MFSWQTIVLNGLWILGLAMVVAACSYENWRVRQGSDEAAQRSFRHLLGAGLMLISLSLMFLAEVWWERVIWFGFAGLFMGTIRWPKG
jgi:hypothetical protein